jgi:hypothetical protein
MAFGVYGAPSAELRQAIAGLAPRTYSPFEGL